MSRAIDLRAGDCIDVMRSLKDACVDAVVTDPPYGLEFMGKEWDKLGASSNHRTDRAAEMGDENKRRYIATGITYGRDVREMQEWHREWAVEALRVLKPGGHCVVFGGTRTYHRMVCGLEDAGFEIRDQLAWMFGSGFPKSLDVSKAIDAAAGAEREVVGVDAGKAQRGAAPSSRYEKGDDWSRPSGIHNVFRQTGEITAPATEDAARWQGWGTALKPGYEPVVLARKPLCGTVAANVLEFGVGALNVDGCRIETGGENFERPAGSHSSKHNGWQRPWQSDDEGIVREQATKDLAAQKATDLGRWPANVVLDPDAAAMLDEQSGDRPGFSGGGPKPGVEKFPGVYGDGMLGGENNYYGDTGGASRFFYCAKVDSQERNAGLAVPSLFSQDGPDRNTHPTVKPVDMMRWLCRLVTPPGGLILDPFMGSGSTGIAAHLEGFSFIGVEREAEYMEISRARLSHWAAQEVEVVA